MSMILVRGTGDVGSALAKRAKTLEDLGEVSWSGRTRDLEGEPRELAGHVEVDPRGLAEAVHGVGERPRLIAQGVLRAVSAGPS